ncbi:sulfurtransferase [Streptomyces radicis]|uniref:Sulfurtransferase n=1 Tax=Streptomyces radicis TaxID=1750517 RepID=A0A3A9VU22_9ACTN|nr:sulfurtransferase [Streptomyces radicis]RKN04591.1 sulfurtransferase [Streptomyces radicis]RKN15547.1 sulfurtransferase [Streptomyces radicis]
MPVLVSPDELAALLAADPRVRVLDVRWSLAAPDGLPAHRAGHIPGAVHVDLERELSAPATPGGGRHPLPPIADLRRAASRWGVDDGDPVVVHDDSGGLAAARAWWLLRHAGVADVRVLDGAFAAWRAAGLPVATGDEPAPPPGNVRLSYGHLPVIDADEAAALPDRGTLLDARAAARYRGDEEPVDPRAGHIPGAVSAPATDHLDPAGRFRSPAELRVHYAALGVRADRPTAVYCGSGVTAAHSVLALAVAGVDAALFPGSWSAWSADPARPVATGASPRPPAPTAPPAPPVPPASSPAAPTTGAPA